MLRRTLQSLLVLMVIVGCDDSTRPQTTLTGTWSLETVNGKPLPFTLPETGEVVTAEVVTLEASGHFIMTTTFRFTDGNRVFTESVPDTGTYVVKGFTVTLTYNSDGSTDMATVNGDLMTLEDIGQVWVYRRRLTG